VTSFGVTIDRGMGCSHLIINGDFGTGNFTGWTLTTTSANGTFGPSPPFLQVTSFNVTGSGATNAAQFQVGEVIFTGVPA
jgi:hypothetical protein